MPSSMACDMKGCIGSTMAPARSNRRAACSTAARISGSTARPQPASSSRPMRRPRRWSGADVEGGPGDVLRRQAHAVARVGLRQHLHHQRGVGHGARHRPGGAAHVGRVDRDAAQAGLEREDAAPAGRQAQRAADVGADVQRAVAGRRGRAGAGAGAARRLAQVPGVARQRVEARQARGQHAVVGHGGLAHDHRAGFLQARGRRRVGRGGPQLDGRRAGRHRVAARRDVFLDGDRHAVERAERLAAPPARLGGARLLERGFGPQQPGGLQVRLPALDVVEHRLRDLDRREAALAVGGDQFRVRTGRAGALLTTSDSADRSLAKIGMSFHRPLTPFLATVGNCGWNRKPLAASLASSFCASPSSLLRSAGVGRWS